MNSIELLNVMSCNNVTKKAFQGVYPSDFLPKHKLRKPCILIANTDPSSRAGAHWTAFYLPARGRKGEFFCSFGSQPQSPTFTDFLARNCKSYISCTRQLQSNFSDVCGQFSCVYLYCRIKGKSLKKFMDMFKSRNLKYNDAKVRRLYRKYFRSGNSKISRHYIQNGGNTPCIQKCKSRLDVNDVV